MSAILSLEAEAIACIPGAVAVKTFEKLCNEASGPAFVATVARLHKKNAERDGHSKKNAILKCSTNPRRWNLSRKAEFQAGNEMPLDSASN